jgi:hypothetical protein
MALLKHQTKIAFIDKRGLDRAVEKLARRGLRKTRRRLAATVSDIKKRLQRRLARFIEDEDQHLKMETITKAPSQRVWTLRRLRSCLRPVEWTAFTPEPRWHWPRRPSDRAAAGGGTYGTTGNLYRIAWKPLIPVTNKSTQNCSAHPVTQQSEEPNPGNREGDATNLTGRTEATCELIDALPH